MKAVYTVQDLVSCMSPIIMTFKTGYVQYNHMTSDKAMQVRKYSLQLCT